MSKDVTVEKLAGGTGNGATGEPIHHEHGRNPRGGLHNEHGGLDVAAGLDYDETCCLLQSCADISDQRRADRVFEVQDNNRVTDGPGFKSPTPSCCSTDAPADMSPTLMTFRTSRLGEMASTRCASITRKLACSLPGRQSSGQYC
ncbi:MAG: hypothetical protein GY811_13210 [Myxococcales bacterium]|nr:hypothetical protein [Myxococcales bacterium]